MLSQFPLTLILGQEKKSESESESEGVGPLFHYTAIIFMLIGTVFVIFIKNVLWWRIFKLGTSANSTGFREWF